jgi:hypothetical protein
MEKKWIVWEFMEFFWKLWNETVMSTRKMKIFRYMPNPSLILPSQVVFLIVTPSNDVVHFVESSIEKISFRTYLKMDHVIRRGDNKKEPKKEN